MKKVFSIVVVGVAVLLLLSAFSPRKRGLKPGNMAPEVALADTTLLSAGLLDGRYTLLNFWASYDASSRIANICYDEAVSAFDSTRVRYIAVSYDRCAELFDAITKRDGLSMASQYYDRSGEHSPLYRHYRLQNGFESYLIAPDGTIVAQNPDLPTLAKILGE